MTLAPPRSEAPKALRLLHVEDSAGDAKLLQVGLRKLGQPVEVVHATTAGEAVERLGDGDIDVVVLDLNLPDSIGAATYQRVAASAAMIPIVVVTGLEDGVVADELVGLGAQDYLLKDDVTGTALHHAIRLAIKRQQAIALMQHERQRELEAKDRFLSHVSHELRTPLSAVAQFVALLADGTAGELNEDQVDFLGVVQRNVQQLRRMIDDLLTVTRLHGQRLSVDPSPIEVAHVLEHARRSLAVAADDHGVELVVEARAGDVPLVLADADRVFEVVINLVDNAVKFSPAGSQVVMTAALGPGGDDVIVSVADAGPGIDPAYRASVFDPFFQAPERSERTRRGLGLGLYVCHELVTRHGGRIWIDSAPTPGTRIRFSLPVADIAPRSQDRQERI